MIPFIRSIPPTFQKNTRNRSQNKTPANRQNRQNRISLHPFLHLLVLLSLALTISCSGDNKEKIEHDANNRPIQPKFHSFEKEGIWTDKADTHMPEVTKVDSHTLKVVVPLEPQNSPRHYVETIVVMEGERNQLDKKDFSFSYDKPEATFKLKKPHHKGIWIVSKCNMHGMWRTDLKDVE